MDNAKKGRGIILVAGAVIQLFLGIIYVWSVFVAGVAEYFNWEASAVKLTSSFMLCFFVLGILIGGKLQAKISTQKVVLTGGLLLALGMILSAFIPLGYGYLIYVSYGILGGFGVGMGYNAIITSAQKWFPEKRGFATGFSVCAFGFSTVIFAPLVETLLKSYGLQITFIALGVSFLLIVLLLFSFIKLPDETGGGAAAANLANKKQYTTSEILKTKEFYFITISLMLATSVFFILNPSFMSLAAERGLDPSMATVLVMITGVANALGRLGAPLLSDKIGREKAAFIIIAITVIGAGLLCFINGIALIAVIAAIAFCYGGYSGIYPVLTGDYFGIKNVGSNYGAVMVGFALSALLFPIIMNYVTDQITKFIILGGLAAIGAILVLLLKRKEDAV